MGHPGDQSENQISHNLLESSASVLSEQTQKSYANTTSFNSDYMLIDTENKAAN